MVIRETGASRASEIPVLLAPHSHRKWRIGRAIVHRKPKAVPKRICSVLSTLEIKSMGTVDLLQRHFRVNVVIESKLAV